VLDAGLGADGLLAVAQGLADDMAALGIPPGADHDPPHRARPRRVSARWTGPPARAQARTCPPMRRCWPRSAR
jgi:hypothetical protein